MNEPRVLTLDSLRCRQPESTIVWADPMVEDQVKKLLPFATRSPLTSLPEGVQSLIVVAGGTLIDEAKVWRLENAPYLELVVIPSIWGSGAEASPIAVRNRGGKKEIRMDPRLQPDARAILPELAASIPPERAKLGCGDCWAHALEGFLSPLADAALRVELAVLINQVLPCRLTNDPVWFDFSARACAGQARSSVGLVHGIAHTLEGILRAQQPAADWGHARLCSLFLWPVMRFNELASGKWREISAQYGVDAARVMSVIRSFFDGPVYDSVLPALREHWVSVLSDPCSRTNSALVRPACLEFFVGRGFQ